jgi:septum formation protein
MSAPPLILASASPRRRELLALMRVPFEVATAEVDEHDATSAPHLAPRELARENARLKALAVAALKPGRWVLGADTVVGLGNKTFGKPASLSQAKQFLRELSGQTHEVITACALVAPDGTIEFVDDVSRVIFHELSDETIEQYLAAVNVLDKAGAYAVQEQPVEIIARVDGSRYNVMGLPTGRLNSLLQKHGLLST